VNDELRSLEEQALQHLAGRLATEERLARWAWDEPEMPPVDEFYLRDLQVTWRERETR
jgi:hypothetical protein